MAGEPGPDEGWYRRAQPWPMDGRRAPGDEPCERATQGTDMLGAPCPACGHSNMLHPGRPNPDLGACVVCQALSAIEGLEVRIKNLEESRGE